MQHFPKPFKHLNSMTQSPVIQGTIILTVTGFATRIIGFYNRIFLNDLIGATQLGLYQLIFPLYMVAFAITSCGNVLALTKLISEYNSRNDSATSYRFFTICFWVNTSCASIISILMHENANWLCTRILKAPECSKCLKIISIGIPFMAAKGAIHGFFLGQKKSGVHGISDFIEQTSKIVGLYVLSSYFCIQKHYSASFAVWGIVIGEISAFAYSLFALLHHNKKSLYKTSPPAVHRKKCFLIFFKTAIPLTTNKLALNILQSVEAILIPTVLLSYYKVASTSLATYGVFTGMAFPFIMFPSTITNSLSTMLLPAVSGANSQLNRAHLKKLSENSIHFCLLIGLFSTIAFYIFGPSIGLLIFHNQEAGIYLFELSFLCPLLYLSTTLASILNGLGFATHNLILTFFATIIRISFILKAIPHFGIKGYIMGLFCSYLFLTLASLNKLQKHISFEINFSYSVFYPLLLFIITGIPCYLIFQKISHNTVSSFSTVLWLILFICIYATISLIPMLLLSKKSIKKSFFVMPHITKSQK